MTFAIKGGGVSSAMSFFFSNFFVLKPARITPWLPKRVLHIVWALYYIYLVVGGDFSWRTISDALHLKEGIRLGTAPNFYLVWQLSD